MSDEDEAVMLIVVLGNQYIPQKVSKALARSTIDSWVTGKIETYLLFHESAGEPPIAACRADCITGMYFTPVAASPGERLAAAMEKTLEDGEEWKR